MYLFNSYIKIKKFDYIYSSSINQYRLILDQISKNKKQEEWFNDWKNIILFIRWF